MNIICCGRLHYCSQQLILFSTRSSAIWISRSCGRRDILLSPVVWLATNLLGPMWVEVKGHHVRAKTLGALCASPSLLPFSFCHSSLARAPTHCTLCKVQPFPPPSSNESNGPTYWIDRKTRKRFAWKGTLTGSQGNFWGIQTLWKLCQWPKFRRKNKVYYNIWASFLPTKEQMEWLSVALFALTLNICYLSKTFECF